MFSFQYYNTDYDIKEFQSFSAAGPARKKFKMSKSKNAVAVNDK